MSKLVGARWGSLADETKGFLLENANVWDDIKEGDCIVDLTSTLSVEGKIICEFEDEVGYIHVEDEAVIYNSQEGIRIESKETEFIINEVMTVTEAAEQWGLTEGAIRLAIKSKKFIPGIDYRKAGRITLITKEAMLRVYGKPNPE